MSAATVSRWSGRYVLASAVFLVAWQVAVVTGVAGNSRATAVTLAVYGYVLHMVFGKAYALVPSYFVRDLAVPRAPAVQFPLVSLGTVGLVADAAALGPSWFGSAGAVLWSLGVGVFVGTLAVTIRTNPTGSETGTGEANAELRPTDRLANGFVPVALGYLLLGTWGTLTVRTAISFPFPFPYSVAGPQVTHLLAAGTAGLLVFALGARLLPRFLVATPSRRLVGVVLPAGALGPILLASHLGAGRWFRLGALVQATAVVGYAVLVARLAMESDRRRVGFYGVLAGAAAGVAAVALGLGFAFGHTVGFGGTSPATVRAHLRLNLLGFLGLTIVGLAFQFYPPAVGAWPWSSDRTAAFAIAGLAGGVGSQAVGLVAGLEPLTTLGELAALGGAVTYAWLIASAFASR